MTATGNRNMKMLVLRAEQEQLFTIFLAACDLLMHIGLL